MGTIIVILFIYCRNVFVYAHHNIFHLGSIAKTVYKLIIKKKLT